MPGINYVIITKTTRSHHLHSETRPIVTKRWMDAFLEEFRRPLIGNSREQLVSLELARAIGAP